MGQLSMVGAQHFALIAWGVVQAARKKWRALHGREKEKRAKDRKTIKAFFKKSAVLDDTECKKPKQAKPAGAKAASPQQIMARGNRRWCSQAQGTFAGADP